MHAAKSWQASYPANAIRLCRLYSLARELSNFLAVLPGNDFKAAHHVLKSSYGKPKHNKNSLILCTTFLHGMSVLGNSASVARLTTHHDGRLIPN
jgi:hypothetical protein